MESVFCWYLQVSFWPFRGFPQLRQLPWRLKRDLGMNWPQWWSWIGRFLSPWVLTPRFFGGFILYGKTPYCFNGPVYISWSLGTHKPCFRIPCQGFCNLSCKFNAWVRSVSLRQLRTFHWLVWNCSEPGFIKAWVLSDWSGIYFRLGFLS